MSSAASVTQTDFESEVLQADQPVLVDFWAPWCPPCLAIAPTLDAIAEEYRGRAKIVKVDIDEEPEIADRYGIRSIPTLIVFRGGEKVNEMVGAYPKAAIASILDEAL